MLKSVGLYGDGFELFVLNINIYTIFVRFTINDSDDVFSTVPYNTSFHTIGLIEHSSESNKSAIVLTQNATK